MLRLITIPISHYCEKARWALDRARLPYEEQALLPLVHLAATLPAARHRTVPVLVHPGGAVAESSEILRWVDAHAPSVPPLFPTDPAELSEVERWVLRFDKVLGRSARLWAYSVLVNHPQTFKRQFQSVYGGVQRALVPALVPLGIAGVRRRYGVSDSRGAAALERCREVFEEVAQALEGDRRFLVGERFTAADLTFASLAAPLVLAPEYAGCLLPPEAMPEEYQRVAAELRTHAAGEYLLRVYSEQR